MTSTGKIKINGHNTKPTEPEPATVERDAEIIAKKAAGEVEWTDEMIGVCGLLRYKETKNGDKTINWRRKDLAHYFGAKSEDAVSYPLEMFNGDPGKYRKAAERYILPKMCTGCDRYSTKHRKRRKASD